MSLRELLIESVATIADGLAEVGPVGLLKSEDRRCVIRAEALQFEHPSNLPFLGGTTTGVTFVHADGPSPAQFKSTAPSSPYEQSRSSRASRACTAFTGVSLLSLVEESS
jgi:hypothetical protein